MPRSIGEKLAAKFERILAAGFSHFIDKALRDVAVLRISDGTPETHGHVGLGQNIIAVKIGDAVFEFSEALDGTSVETILDRAGEEARHDGRANDADVH